MTKFYEKDGKTYVYRKNPPEMTFEEKEELSKEEYWNIFLREARIGDFYVKSKKRFGKD